MSGKIILRIMKNILLKMKTILRIVGLKRAMPSAAENVNKTSVVNEPFIAERFARPTVQRQTS